MSHHKEPGERRYELVDVDVSLVSLREDVLTAGYYSMILQYIATIITSY
jgi:hypothetical protein